MRPTSIERFTPRAALSMACGVACHRLNAVALNNPNRLAIRNGKYDTDLARPYLGYSSIQIGETAAGSNYNSLQTSFRIDVWQGLTLQASYTWSHSLDYGSGDFTYVSNPFDRRYDYGPSDLDRRHIVSLNYIYQLPILRNKEGLTGSLLGGWEFSGITLMQTGTPMTPGLGSDNLGIGGGNSRPDAISPVNYPKTINEWFDPSAFATPAPLAFGSAGRGLLRGPGRTNFNLSLFKSFRIPFGSSYPEGARLQFRAESFNAFNHL